MARKPGKYDAALANMTALPIVDDSPARQEMIDKIKDDLKDLNAVELATIYGGVRRERDKLKAEEAELQLQLDALTQLLIANEDAGTDEAWGAYGANDNSIRLANGDTLRVNKEPASKVVDPDAFRRWCMENGYERKLQLHAGTRESIVAERVLTLEPMPDGLEVGSWTKLTFTPCKEVK